MLMLSRDVIETFLDQAPHLMRCHPWADQMIGFWVSDLGLNNLYQTDHRSVYTFILKDFKSKNSFYQGGRSIQWQ